MMHCVHVLDIIIKERSTPCICFSNALRLFKFLSSLLTFDQMKGPFLAQRMPSIGHCIKAG